MRSIGGKTPRRATVIGARWVSIVGQTLAVAAAAFVFDVQASYAGFILVLALGAVINAAFAIGLSDSQRLTDGQTAWALTADLAQIAALLALAGGVLNPFAIFLLGPATVAATVLSSRSAILVGAASAVAVVALAIAHLPLAFADGTVVEPSFERRLAAVTALLAALGFVPLYARRVAVEAFDMSAALAAAQMALEQEQRVSAIGAMAAAVAHELGTPLATIKLSASELKRELSDNPDAYEDVLLIAEQADRCRSILAELSAVKAPEDAQIRSAPIMAVLQEAAEPHHNRRAEILFRLNGAPAGPDDPPAPQPDVPRRPELIHGLRNLIQNAADFAASTVWVDVTLDGSGATIAIGDDGAGFSTEILDQLGEPFATTRGRVGEAAGAYVGMGLGVFIAKTLLERTGARLRFENAARTPPRRRAEGASGDARPVRDPGDRPTGAIVRVEWSAEALPLSPPRAAPTDAGATQHAPS